jgi:hypothetical protein
MQTFRPIACVLALAGLGMLAGVAQADGPQAIAQAAQHAGLAVASADSGDFAGVRRHLHHSLNCLVGPEGEGFDQSAGNPCVQAGGAIPQTSDAELREKLEALAAQIRDGVMGDDLAAAKELAADVQEMLAN